MYLFTPSDECISYGILGREPKGADVVQHKSNMGTLYAVLGTRWFL